MKRTPRPVPLALCAALATLASCASTSQSSHDAMPFHVALLPVVATGTSGTHVAAQDDGVRLSLEPGALSRDLRSSLDGACFTRASLLAPPAGVPAAEFETWSASERDDHWLAEAERIGADLVLECEVASSGRAVGAANDKFWLNLPLFLLGGPSCYFVGDRTYTGDARLRAALYELHALRSGRATLADGRSRVVQAEARFRSESLTFLERADGGVGQYLLSLVVPAGLLAREGRGVEESLSTSLAEQLSSGLTEELGRQRDEIADADRVAPFRLDPAVRIEASEGELAVRGDVLLRVGDVERMEECLVRHGGAQARVELGAGARDDALSSRREEIRRIPFAARLPRVEHERFVRIELVAGGRTPIVRSFTLPVDLHDH